MKAQLLVNLKHNTGTTEAGTMYDDSIEEFPEYIISNLENPRIVKVFPELVVKVAPAEEFIPAPAAKPAAAKPAPATPAKPKLAAKSKG